MGIDMVGFNTIVEFSEKETNLFSKVYRFVLTSREIYTHRQK